MYPAIFADKWPDKPAYIMAGSGEVVTYGALDAASNRIARFFREAGLRPGDGIALLMENHPRYYEIVWAAQRSGLYYTSISTHLTAEEVAYILRDSGARLVVTTRRMAEVAGALPDLVPHIGHWLMLDGAQAPYHRFEEAARPFSGDRLDAEREGASLLYSSGTTGRPKGILRPPPEGPMGQDASVQLTVEQFGATAESVYLSPAPLYHSAPLHFNIRFQRLGATCVIMEKFDALAALRLIEAHRVTHSQWVPTMFIRLLGLPEEDRARFDLASHRCAIHAAAPCPVQIKKRMIDWWGPILAEYYGATERNGMTVIQADEWLARPGSVGRAVMGRIHILDEDGTELPPGEAGTVYFEGGGAFEYLNDPDKTRDAFDSHGWSTVGDMGYVDADGYLFLTDRKAHMIISGGVNIYPQETENLLAAHPRVADVAVIGVPNAEFGEEVKAVVQLLDPAEAGPDMARALIAHCARHLSKIKCPRSVDFVDELPRHPTGKLYKRLLRDRYWQGRDSRIV